MRDYTAATTNRNVLDNILAILPNNSYPLCQAIWRACQPKSILWDLIYGNARKWLKHIIVESRQRLHKFCIHSKFTWYYDDGNRLKLLNRNNFSENSQKRIFLSTETTSLLTIVLFLNKLKNAMS